VIEQGKFSNHLRPLDNSKDLNAVADLIEICFSEHMDADGREYLHQIRRAAQDVKFLHWIPGAGEMASYPLHGYVWEEDGKVIGNLTLIPSFVDNQWRYMIVNVAVHPDYRRHGIARQLTLKGLDHVHNHGAAAAWLQVRDDNQPAIDLYTSLGFKERARRSTWINDNHDFDKPNGNGISISRRQDKDWNLHHVWLKHDYPSEVSWHLPFSIRKFKPSLINKLDNFFSDLPTTHWTAYRYDSPVGFLTLEPTHLSADTLWLAISPQYSELAIKTLLTYAHHIVPAFRPITINYPANIADEAFRLCGFTRQNTLIWMEVSYQSRPASIIQKLIDRIVTY
jgi:ribosomal protein S18 acetylase RimI-like enzyme